MTRTKRSKHVTKSMPYEAACLRYVAWAEAEAARLGGMSCGVPTPNAGLSMLIGSTWHLRNVNGPLAKVGANGRVWRPNKLDA